MEGDSHIILFFSLQPLAYTESSKIRGINDVTAQKNIYSHAIELLLTKALIYDSEGGYHYQPNGYGQLSQLHFPPQVIHTDMAVSADPVYQQYQQLYDAEYERVHLK